jgi:hypothetical protein
MVWCTDASPSLDQSIQGHIQEQFSTKDHTMLLNLPFETRSHACTQHLTKGQFGGVGHLTMHLIVGIPEYSP